MMSELFFFDSAVLGMLPPTERVRFEAISTLLAIPNGRPFFLRSDGLPDCELDGFCDYLLDPRRRSAETWATYAIQVGIFLRFMKAQKKSWKQATESDLKKYYNVRTTGKHQIGPRLKGQSWNVVKTAIVHLYEYALDARLIAAVPFKYRRSHAIFGGKNQTTADISAKTEPEQINFISIAHYKTIWRPLITQHRNSQRNLALTDLLITVGLRISEALALQVNQLPDPDDIAYAGKKSVPLRVVGKGKKPRMARLPKRILRAILFYVKEERQATVAVFRKKHPNSEEPRSVFLSKNGNALCARSVQDYFRKLSTQCRIRLTPHGCRHTFAVYQLEAMIKRMARNLRELRSGGADAYRQVLNDPLRQLQLLLGHAHISTTYIYLDFLEESEALVDESLADWTSWEDSHAK
ncbi:integrase domain-containing protein SAM domain-containing protein [Burkholderia pseudomallei]|nr:integrase domain-containing protein SAM domain-containing protein [Burkholderia pseudomallei]